MTDSRKITFYGGPDDGLVGSLGGLWNQDLPGQPRLDTTREIWRTALYHIEGSKAFFTGKYRDEPVPEK